MMLAPRPFYPFGCRPVATNMRIYSAAMRALPYRFIGVDEAANMDDHTWDALRYMATPGWPHGLHKIKKEKKTMFGWKKTILGIKNKLDEVYSAVLGKDGDGYSAWWNLKNRINELESKTDVEHIDCHTCGCVVRKEIAFRGHDRIERVIETLSGMYIGDKDGNQTYTEETHETWYCKRDKRGKKAYGSE